MLLVNRNLKNFTEKVIKKLGTKQRKKLLWLSYSLPKNVCKHAKWIRWDIKRPGVAPCEGHFEFFGRKWQRQLTGSGVGPEKNSILSQKLIVKTGKTPPCTLENTGNNFVLHNGGAKPTSSW